jgi:hypothetical protein
MIAFIESFDQRTDLTDRIRSLWLLIRFVRIRVNIIPWACASYVFGYEFESLASYGLLNYSEPETSVWLLLPEHRHLGQTVISDQSCMPRKATSSWSVTKPPAGNRGPINLPSGLTSTFRDVASSLTSRIQRCSHLLPPEEGTKCPHHQAST